MTGFCGVTPNDFASSSDRGEKQWLRCIISSWIHLLILQGVFLFLEVMNAGDIAVDDEKVLLTD